MTSKTAQAWFWVSLLFLSGASNIITTRVLQHFGYSRADAREWGLLAQVSTIILSVAFVIFLGKVLNRRDAKRNRTQTNRLPK